MLRIKETQPYYILPTQRYDLTTKPPSKSMQGDFTFFTSFKVDEIIKTSTPCSVMMRPGMHYGLCYCQSPQAINWEYWYIEDDEKKFGLCSIDVETEWDDFDLQNTWFVIVRHNLELKQFQLKVWNELGDVRQHTSTYKGELVNYSGTPYNFGCGNYFKQVDASHYFFGDYTLFNVGLMETIKHDDEDIQEFISTNRESFEYLNEKNSLQNLVFYFNMKNQSIYKIWDLSNHCNFLMRNMDVFK